MQRLVYNNHRVSKIHNKQSSCNQICEIGNGQRQRTCQQLVQRKYQSLRVSAAQDPYKVLGIGRGADSERIDKAYRKAKYKAQQARDDELLKQLEDAHGSVMMDQLQKRCKGSMDVDQSIAQADRPMLFPWRPRQCPLEGIVLKIYLAIQGVLMAWGILSYVTAYTQPAVYSTGAAFVIQIYKQQELNKSKFGNEKSGAFKILIRSAFLAMLGTGLGVFLLYTFPDLLASALKRYMAPWFYDYSSILITIGAVGCNTVLGAYYR